jgi:Ca2+-binding RTX toxin-like protein
LIAIALTFLLPAISTLKAASGNDIITANEGDDTLTGNGGVDTFDYNSVADGNDTISDFVIGHGSDKLDLSDLLKGETSTTRLHINTIRNSGWHI